MATAMIAAAGEHFVAYRLSSLGLLAALTRGGSPSVDILVSDPAGLSTISLQVKTSHWAWREYKRKPDRNHWEWFVGANAKHLRSDTMYYAFVDLKGCGTSTPDVFVIPSAIVADAFAGTDYAANVFWLMAGNRDRYLEAWQPIRERLTSNPSHSPDPIESITPEEDEPTNSPAGEL